MCCYQSRQNSLDSGSGKMSEPGEPSKITKRLLAFEKSQKKSIKVDFGLWFSLFKIWLMVAASILITSVLFTLWRALWSLDG